MDAFEIENKFYESSSKDRINKLLAHYELYKKIINIPGEVIEFGVFKGNSLIRLATFRDALETPFSRKIIGFDIFGKFPSTNYEPDKEYLEQFIESAGEESISIDDLRILFKNKNIQNFDLIKGNIIDTVPEYKNKNPHTKIALLHIDTDVYEPAKIILDHFYDLMVPGGIIMFDDYGTFPGETKAVDELIKDYGLKINKLSFYKTPSYIIKEN
jgi:hypothetical protein